MDAKETRIVGVRLDDLEPLARHQYLRLDPGVTVLYGLNGAGKSRVLAAIESGEILLKCPPLPPRGFKEDGKSNRRFDDGDICPNYDSLWGSGILSPGRDNCRGWYYDGIDYASGISHDYNIAELLATNSLDDHALSRFEALTRSPFSFTVRTRLWSILLGSAHPALISDCRADQVVDAIIELAEQAFISLQRDPTAGSIVRHRAVLHEAGPLRRLFDDCLLAVEEVSTERSEAASVEELTTNDWDDYCFDVLRGAYGDRHGYGFLLRWAVAATLNSRYDPTSGTDPLPPGWFGHAVHAFRTSGIRPYLDIITEADEPFGTATSDRIKEALGNHQSANGRWMREVDLVEGSATGMRLTPAAEAKADDLAATASSLFTELLEGAPPLTLRLAPQDRWPTTGLLEWSAQDRSGRWVPLEQLSSAQLRWARFSIQLALAGLAGRRPLLMLLDEPERALHRRAERHLFEALLRIAERHDAVVVVATHSPVLLSHPDVRVAHVTRNTAGLAEIRTAEVDVRSDFRELGLEPADLLQLVRAVVLVEGEHDKWVLESLFGPQLRDHGVEIIPLRGAKQLKSAAEANFLFNFTDVPIVLVLDNERTERIESIWQQALDAKRAGAPEDRINQILQQISSVKGGEARALYEFCRLSIDKEQSARLQFAMLSKADITEYFAPSDFIRSARRQHTTPTDWPTLHGDYQAAKDQFEAGTRLKTKAFPNFKAWLVERHGAQFDEQTFRSAVGRLDAIHPDFQALLNRILRACAPSEAADRSS